MKRGGDLRRGRTLLPVALLALWNSVLATACNAENGTGTLDGLINVPACQYDSDYKPVPLEGTPPFHRVWKYFVAEPFDSNGNVEFPENQINIRVQGTSGRPESADALTFWVLDSYEVARCMRHRLNADGSKDWNELVCDADGVGGPLGPKGEGRMLIGTEAELVRSHFVLRHSCLPSLSSDALGTCVGNSCPPVILCPGRGSWIIFTKFGVAPAALSQVLNRDFKVNTGDPIQAAAYHVELCDASTVEAQQAFRVPVPAPQISGTLDGSFAFSLAQ